LGNSNTYLVETNTGRELTTSGLQVGDQRPDLVRAEIGFPAGHHRASGEEGFDGFPLGDPPVEIGRIDFGIMPRLEIRGRRRKKICPRASSLPRIAVA